jgi:hypothetical protein
MENNMNKIISATLIKTAIVYTSAILIFFMVCQKILVPDMVLILGSSQSITLFIVVYVFGIYAVVKTLEISLMLMEYLPIERLLYRLFRVNLGDIRQIHQSRFKYMLKRHNKPSYDDTDGYFVTNQNPTIKMVGATYFAKNKSKYMDMSYEIDIAVCDQGKASYRISKGVVDRASDILTLSIKALTRHTE